MVYVVRKINDKIWNQGLRHYTNRQYENPGGSGRQKTQGS